MAKKILLAFSPSTRPEREYGAISGIAMEDEQMVEGVRLRNAWMVNISRRISHLCRGKRPNATDRRRRHGRAASPHRRGSR